MNTTTAVSLTRDATSPTAIGEQAVRLRDAVEVLSRSFHDQPHFMDMFPDPGRRGRALPHVFTALLGDATAHGRLHATLRDGELAGVAVWYAPHRYPLTARRQLRSLPALARVAAAAPRSLRRVMQFQAAAAALHPSQPYWYLAAVGVDPAFQGRGIGTDLVALGLTQADAAGQACYLETHAPRTVDWYRGLGFEVRESEVPFTPGGPPNWTMVRPGARG